MARGLRHWTCAGSAALKWSTGCGLVTLVPRALCEFVLVEGAGGLGVLVVVRVHVLGGGVDVI